MAATLSVKVTQAQKLLKELGTKNATKLEGAKLEKALKSAVKGAADMEEDDLEALSKASQTLLGKLADAKKYSIEAADDEGDDDDGEEEKSSKKKGSGKKKAAKARSGEPSLKTQQGHAINEVLDKAKGPLSLEDIHKKAKKTVEMSEGRVQNHLDYLVDTKETVKKKGGKYALA